MPTAAQLRAYLQELGWKKQQGRGHTMHRSGSSSCVVPDDPPAGANWSREAWQLRQAALETIAQERRCAVSTILREAKETRPMQAGLFLDIPKRRPLPDRPQECPRLRGSLVCNGQSHYLPGERGGEACPLAGLRQALSSWADLWAAYAPEVAANGWQRTDPIDRWPAALLGAVSLQRGIQGMPEAKAHVLEMASKRPGECGGLLLCGQPGNGKTMLGLGLVLSWLARPVSRVMILRWSRIVALANMEPKQQALELQALRQRSAILIDDLGRDRYGWGRNEPGSAPTANVLCDLFEGWTGWAGATSNLSPAELQASPEVGPRAFSRLAATRDGKPAAIFELAGPDQRTADAVVFEVSR